MDLIWFNECVVKISV